MCSPDEVAVVIVRSIPTPRAVEVAKDCDATLLPLRVLIVPPAPPASVPQVKVPFTQRSFSVEELQDVRLAP